MCRLKISTFLLVLMSTFVACDVEEGEGGTATIKGRLVLEQYNDDFSYRVDSLAAADEDVFIIYGDDLTVGDDTKTNYNGCFEFPYLYEGNYTILYYSIDSTDYNSGKKEVLLNVDLSKGEILDLGDLKSYEILDDNDGTATIKGKLILEQYNDDFSLRIDSKAAADERVYIVCGEGTVIDDDVRTSYDGSFEFSDLNAGNYTVFYYSIDSADYTSDEKEVLIDVDLSDSESLDLGELKCYEALNYDDGKVTIQGCVYEVTFTVGSSWPSMTPEDTLTATEKEVYLRYGEHEFYDERVRTQADGSFYFQDLIPGTYTIYVMSEDIRGTDQEKEIKKSITIEVNVDTTYVLDNLYIYDL